MRSHRLDLKTMDQFRVTNKREGAGSGRYIYRGVNKTQVVEVR